MKVHFLILAIFVLVISCKKEDSNSKVSNTYRTVLKSIENPTDGGNTRFENFTYDDNNNLLNVHTFYENSGNEGHDYQTSYEGNQLTLISRFNKNDGTLTSKDSFIYDTKGKIDKIFFINRNGGNGLEVNYINDYSYDENSKILEETTIHNSFIHRDSFVWENDNITKKFVFDESGLRHIFTYKYDNSNNPKKDLPYYLRLPIYQSKNNIIEESAEDFTGLLDLYCNPCKHKYKYNLDNYPVEIKFQYDKIQKITYQQ